jgi:hypothetical protein
MLLRCESLEPPMSQLGCVSRFVVLQSPISATKSATSRREQMQHYSITTSARTAMGQDIERTSIADDLRYFLELFRC